MCTVNPNAPSLRLHGACNASCPASTQDLHHLVASQRAMMRS